MSHLLKLNFSQFSWYFYGADPTLNSGEKRYKQINCQLDSSPSSTAKSTLASFTTLKKVFKLSPTEVVLDKIVKTVYKVCRRGGRRVFAGTMKYFRQLLMGHETFLNIFDGPQKCFYVFLFFFFFFF